MDMNINIPYVKGQTGTCYQILRELSSGSFGVVYEAVRLDPDNLNQIGKSSIDHDKIILKIINTDSVQAKKNMQNFDQELRVSREISDNKLAGFSTCLDWGTVERSHIKQFYRNADSKFIVQNRLGKTIDDIFQSNDRRIRQIDVIKLGI